MGPVAERVDTPGGQLDRKRDPVQPAADIHDDPCIRVGQFESIQTLGRAFDKELNRWIGDCLLCRKAGGDGWNAQWAQSLYALALGAQRFATGRQDVDARRASEHLFCQGGGRIDDMLAAIEYEQHLLVAKQCNQSRNRTVGADCRSEHESEGARHEQGVGQGREIDETDTVGIGRS